MGILKNFGYSYGDLTIIPKSISEIESRSMCNPRYQDGMLPIFTAPMTCVVNELNFDYWKESGIIPILPRTSLPKWEDKVDFIYSGSWVALGLEEFKRLISEPLDQSLFKEGKIRILLDIANGHMKKVLDLCKEIRLIYGDFIELMSGNIANPDTYSDYCNAGIDYVRCSIGSGAGCLTTSNTGIHYPIASLLDEINKRKAILGTKATTKIIADGGIRNYSDVIKALALGADYVMIGGLLTSVLESASELISNGFGGEGLDVIDYKTVEFTVNINGCTVPEALRIDWGDIEVKNRTVEKRGYLYLTYTIDLLKDSEVKKRQFLKMVNNNKKVLEKEFYGMSTKKAQTLMGKKTLKTSEGKERRVYVNHTLKQWVENMEDYLKSAMSYCNSRTLKDFIGKQNLIPNSPGELAAVNK